MPYANNDVIRIYLPRQRGGQRFIWVNVCVKSQEINLTFYVKNMIKEFLIIVKNKILNSDEAK